MATLEKRVSDLEAKVAGKEESLKLVFCKEGQTNAQARLEAGISADYQGRVICVQFVEANKGDGHGNA